jgi:hypothetical protein
MDEFGSLPEDPTEKPILMMVPLRPLNGIEHELVSNFMEELSTKDVPVPFADDDGSLENGDDYVVRFGRALNLDEAMTIRSLIEDEVLAKYRMQIIIARELGETQRDGRPTIEEYRAACAAENVEPLLCANRWNVKELDRLGRSARQRTTRSDTV